MTESAANKPSDRATPTHCDVRVSVNKFGPIDKGFVELRPLTVFVGPSNTGKTYLAILIYALHKTLHGFPRFPTIDRYIYSQEEDGSIASHELQKMVDKINTKEASVRFSDLPIAIRNSALKFLTNEAFLAEELRLELEHCFGLESVADLIRKSDQSNKMSLSIEVRDAKQHLWDFILRIVDSGMTSDGSTGMASDGNISDMKFPIERNIRMRSTRQRLVSRLLYNLGNESERITNSQVGYALGELWSLLLHPTRENPVESYYLPAARSGIMQSHRVIASSLVARATRAGLERFPELPTFSGVLADFMQRLILYDVPGSSTGLLPRRRQARKMKDLANEMERAALGGQIRTRRPSPSSYPEFVYRPVDIKQDIRLSRASSMVSELAPVVLFLRGNLGAGDTLIIEEPEAHLHPAAQTEMAAILARLIRYGVRVVVTTHSDWLLKEIGNLMREGELEEKIGESESDALSTSSIHPRDVGIWLFQKGTADQGSTIKEIEFDRIEGIEPVDYEAVAEQLYNRSADLQNRLEEVTKER